MRTLLRILLLLDVSVAALNDQFVTCIPIAAFHYLTQIRTLGWKPNTAVPPNVSY
jgi:hypothetical protein